VLFLIGTAIIIIAIVIGELDRRAARKVRP